MDGLLCDCLDLPVVVYGWCEMFNYGTPQTEFRRATPFSQKLLETVDFIDQPSVFWTRKAWEIVGPLDESLHFGFAWEWFLRAGKACRFMAFLVLAGALKEHLKN